MRAEYGHTVRIFSPVSKSVRDGIIDDTEAMYKDSYNQNSNREEICKE